MPRNASGVYTLPPTNPVVPSTTIATSWANPTLSDVASALTDSLDRTGRGGMLAPFKIYDGNVNAPGLSFLNEPNMGIWRASSGVMNISVNATPLLQFSPSQVASLVKLSHYGEDTYKLSGTKSWQSKIESGNLKFTPSASVNSEDWDITKTVTLISTGSGVQLPSAPTPGTLQACTALYAESVAASSGVISFNSRAGVVVLTSGDVTGALGFTPANAAGQAFTGAISSTAGISAGTDLLAPNGRVIVDDGAYASQFVPTEYTASLSGTQALSFANGQSQVIALGGALSASFTNIPAGSMMRVVFTNTSAGLTLTGVSWPSGVTPSYASGSLKKVLAVITNDGGALLANAAVY